MFDDTVNDGIACLKSFSCVDLENKFLGLTNKTSYRIFTGSCNANAFFTHL